MKKTCPGIKNVIELTDEIKQHIMDNRIYKMPEEPTIIIYGVEHAEH